MSWNALERTRYRAIKDAVGQAPREHSHPQPAYARRLHVPLPERSRSILLINAQERTDRISQGLINIGSTWAISAFVYLCISSIIHTVNIWGGFKVLCTISFMAALFWTIALCLSKADSDRHYRRELNAYRECAYAAKQKEEELNARERRRRSAAINNAAATADQGQKALTPITGWSDLDDLFAEMRREQDALDALIWTRGNRRSREK